MNTALMTRHCTPRFQWNPAGNGVDDSGEHAHAVGAYAIHLLGLLLDAAEEVASAHHDADFDAKRVNLDDFVGDSCYLVGIQSETTIAGQRLARKL
jgi:hypothetical protein